MKAPYPQAHTAWDPFNQAVNPTNILCPYKITVGSKLHQVYIDGIEGYTALSRRGLTKNHEFVEMFVQHTTISADKALYDIMEKHK